MMFGLFERLAADAEAAKAESESLAPLVARLHRDSSGGGFLFGFGSNQDFADSEQVIAFWWRL